MIFNIGLSTLANETDFFGGIPMKRLLASVSILALSSVAVSAADLPMKAPPYAAPIPVFSWTGCYVGGHAGAGTMHDSFTQDNIFFSSSGDTHGTGTGGLAGGQIGCNYQDGNWVIGLEGEGYWSGIKTSSGFNFASGTTGEGLAFNARNKSDYSIAARAGIAFDRTLVYGKAGWVWGNFSFDALESATFTGEGGTTTSFETLSQSGQLDGLLLGIGIEHALTQNWTVKLEYNFLDFGSKFLSLTECEGRTGVATTCTAIGSSSQHASKQIFKVGFNYLFNVWGAPPLVAKY
jgi:outer membrane immunogenic protein